MVTASVFLSFHFVLEFPEIWIKLFICLEKGRINYFVAKLQTKYPQTYPTSHPHTEILTPQFKASKSNYCASIRIIMHPILDYSKTNYLGQALKLVPIPLVFCHLVILRFTGLFTCRAQEIEDETQISKF